MAVVLGLSASLLWGASDFLGGLGARRFPLLAVLAVAFPAGVVVIGVIVAARWDAPPDGLSILYAVLAGLGGVVGIAALYRGLAVGAMGVVAPITATAPLIPLVVGLLRGERPGTLRLAGIAVALVVVRPALAPFGQSLSSLAPIGVLDVTATVGFAVATTKGLVSVVAVLASLYPIVVILLARVVLGERLGMVQRMGAVAALAGVALISAG